MRWPPDAASAIGERLRAGDPEALTALHAQVGPAVAGYLRAMLDDRMAAEDVFQHVMIEIWRRAPQFDPDRGSLTTWVMTIARSRAIDELRRRRPQPVDPREISADSLSEPSDDALLERWHLSALLGLIPTEERELLAMRFYAELTQTEIAQRTGLPLGTIKTRMVRGLERLRALIDEDEARCALVPLPAGEALR